ncbi:MAG: alpha/beta fold hydrolase, partial [Ramlibacter sp.]
MALILVNGVRLEVGEIAGPPGARRSPIVFLHEGLGSVAMWRDWPARMCAATGRAGIVYSRRGYGASDPVPDVRGNGRLGPDYMHREAFDVLPALLRALGIEAPVLLGHSDGGTIALLHASRHPLAACVVMAPHVIVEDVSVRSIEQAREAYEAGSLRDRLARYHADVDVAFWQWNDI